MIRHSAGRYESAEGLQFVKGAPPTNHWDVYRNEDDYEPLYESGRGSLQEAMKDFDDFRDANTQKALVDVRDADLMLLHTEREVKIVEDTSNRYGDGSRFHNTIFLGGVPTSLGTKTNKIIHSSKQAAEKAQKKVVAEMEQILADPTLQVKALDDDLWEYTYDYKLKDKMVRATSRAKFIKPTPEIIPKLSWSNNLAETLDYFAEIDSRRKQREASQQVTKFETSAWQREAGKNPKGGLNAAGRAAYNRETGGHLKPPVKSGDNPRRASFLARMGNNAGPERDENGEPTRLLLSLQAWGAESKADARAKAKAISARNANKVDKFAFGFLKGDFVGHPFRGNQWTVGGVEDVVGPRTADEIVTRADLIKFAEMPPAFVGDTELFTHATKSRADRESMLVEGIKPRYELGTVYSSRPPLVRDLGVGYVIFKADKGVAVEGKDIVEIGLSYDEYKFNKTIPPSDIVKVVGTYVFNAGGQNIREDYLADFILKNPDDPQIDALPEKYKRWATLASDVSKGDFVGHPFRGNQWSDSSGASTGSTRSQTLVADRTSTPTQFVDFIAGEKDFLLRQAKERDELKSRKPDTFANPKLKGGIEISNWLKESSALDKRQETEQDNRDYDRYNELKDKLTDEELEALASEKPPADAQEYAKVNLSTPKQTAQNELNLRSKASQPKPAPNRRVNYEQSSVAHKDLMAQRAYAGGESLGQYESDWQGDGWKAIMQVQTNPKSSNSEFAAPVIEAFKEAMVEVNKSTVLYRGMGTLKLDTLDTDFPIGTKIKSKTFISTTTDPATAMSFTRSQGAMLGMARVDQNLPILRITVSKGRKVLPLTGDEFEVVLDSPSTMTVTGRSKVMTLDGEVEVLDVKVG